VHAARTCLSLKKKIGLHRVDLLCMQVLENHVFIDPEIERPNAARDVFIGDAQLRASSSCACPKISL
jgi:hypothetical protein